MRKSAVAAACIIVAGSLFAEYAPEKWNLEAREKFAAQRFGIFIHWGIYANYAQGEWYQQNGSVRRSSTRGSGCACSRTRELST